MREDRADSRTITYDKPAGEHILDLPAIPFQHSQQYIGPVERLQDQRRAERAVYVNGRTPPRKQLVACIAVRTLVTPRGGDLHGNQVGSGIARQPVHIDIGNVDDATPVAHAQNCSIL